MNRVNYGNQITNGMQILSVGAVTAAAKFKRDKADTVLNNTNDEPPTVIAPRPYNKNQISEQGGAGHWNDDEVKVEVIKDEEDDISNIYNNFPQNIINTNQRKSINTKIKNDISYLNGRINNNEFDVMRDILKKQREEQE